MRRSLALLGLSLAWLCAQGVIWDAVQVFAWSRMFAEYAQTMTMTAALKETFDPDKPCELCVTVAKARGAVDPQIPAQIDRTAEKLLLAYHLPSPTVFASDSTAWPISPAAFADIRVEPVPLPPPRA